MKIQYTKTETRTLSIELEGMDEAEIEKKLDEIIYQDELWTLDDVETTEFKSEVLSA